MTQLSADSTLPLSRTTAAPTRPAWRVRATPGVAAALAFALTLPALWNGFAMDDHLMRYSVRRGCSVFSLFSVSGQDVRSGMRDGLFSWWSNPAFSISFFRPLSAWTHILEFRYWPDAAWLMHLGNCVLYALTVFVAARVYRQLLPDRAVAGLAALLFAVDEMHAQSAGWIAGRNTLLSALFALHALGAHARARSEGRRHLQFASTLCIALALCAGEGGLAGVCYLVAYACSFETGPVRQRLLGLWPQLTVCALWAVAYLGLRYGAHGADIYRELGPRSLLQGVLDLPLWLASLLGPSNVSIAMAFEPWLPRALACVFVLPLLVAMLHSWRIDKTLRFFVLGSALSLCTLFATAPQDRVLVIASFGAFAGIAGFICSVSATSKPALRVARGVLVVFHLIYAPLSFGFMLEPFAPVEKAARRLADVLNDAKVPRAVLVNAPLELLPAYALTMFRNQHPSAQASLHALYAGSSELSALRVDARTLELEAARSWAARPIEHVFAAPTTLPAPGATRQLGDLRVQVLASNSAGLPSRVRFQSARALDQAWAWFVWDGAQPVAWRLPPVGERVKLPGLDMLRALPR